MRLGRDLFSVATEVMEPQLLFMWISPGWWTSRIISTMAQVKLSVTFLKSRTITDISTSHPQGHPLTELFMLVLLAASRLILFTLKNTPVRWLSLSPVSR